MQKTDTDRNDRSLDGCRIGVVGLGYVGLPLACLFAKRYPVVGYDCDRGRVAELRSRRDRTGEVDAKRLDEAVAKGLCFTNDVEPLRQCNVYIVAVPTPVDRNNHPDLTPLLDASRLVGTLLVTNDVVVYESTVYPGVTEEECVPVLEQMSGLHCNDSFFVGYSPERVNPGDRQHPLESICKVTSGSTPDTADFVDALYSSVLTGGTHKAPSIRVAETAKIVENCQRDVNIAFMNELARICNAMGVDTGDVLAAAGTKWNFIPLQPGLVGGHCIGVDPYYMIERAQVYGIMPRIMSDARRLNDSMGAYVASQLLKLMNMAGATVKDARILILGFAFKENCPDTRNTKVADIYNSLLPYTRNITVFDPWVDAKRVEEEYGIIVASHLSEFQEKRFDAAVLAVSHGEFAELPLRKLVPPPGIIYDLKRFLPRNIVNARL